MAAAANQEMERVLGTQSAPVGGEAEATTGEEIRKLLTGCYTATHAIRRIKYVLKNSQSGIFRNAAASLGGAFKEGDSFFARLLACERCLGGRRILVLDWDLCMDLISLAYDKDGYANDMAVRKAVLAKTGITDEDQREYFEKLKKFLNGTLAFQNVFTVIITRNSLHNVYECLKIVMGEEKANLFPIISYPENEELNAEKCSKLQLVEHFIGLRDTDAVCLVDDSWVTEEARSRKAAAGKIPEPKEHERCKTYGDSIGCSFFSVKVARPERGKTYKESPGGFLSDKKAFEEFMKIMRTW